MTPRRIGMAGLLGGLLLLASCAETPPPEPEAPPPVSQPQPQPLPVPPRQSQPIPLPPQSSAPTLHCDQLLARQDGRDIRPVGGTLTVARRAFSLVYTGGLSGPALHVSAFPTLAEMLDKAGRSELWGSADEILIHDPDDLPLRDGAGLVEEPEQLDLYLEGMGEGYGAFFRVMTALDGEPAALLSAPRAGMGFAPENGRQVQKVRGLGGVAVEKTRFRQLYLTYFGTVRRAGPGNKGNFGSRALIRLAWGSCRLAFR